MKKIYLITLYLISLTSVSLNAALVWDPENGWGASGGVLEPLIGHTISIKDAEEGIQVGCEEYEAGNILPALRTYRKVYTDYPNSPQAPEALYQIALIYLDRHQYELAFEALQKIILDYPSYPKFNDVIDIEFNIAYKLQNGSRPYYWGLIPGFKDYNASIEHYESIITNAPYSLYAPMALMSIADLAEEHKKLEDVIDALDRLISCYHYCDLAPNAYIKLADTYRKLVHGPSYDQGATLKAINYYEDFLLLFPNNPCVAEVELKLANARDLYARSKLTIGDFFYKYRCNFEAARIYYNEAITVAPNSCASQEAQQRLGLIAQGILPPKTIVDRIFGRYRRPSIPAFLMEMRREERQTEEFDREINEFPIERIDRGYDEFAPGQDPAPAY